MVRKFITAEEAEEIYRERKKLAKIPLSKIIGKPRGTFAEDILKEIGTKKYKQEARAIAVRKGIKGTEKYIKSKVKKIKREFPKSKKIKSKAGELFMAKIKKLQKERDKAIAAQIKERARWVKEMKQRKAIIRQQQMESAEMVAADQRARYEQSDGWTEGRDEVFEMQQLQSMQQPQQQDEYGREVSPASRVGSAAVGGLRRLGIGTQNLLQSLKNLNQQRMMRQQARGGTPIEVNRWHNERTRNILTPERNLLQPYSTKLNTVGQIRTPSPFTTPQPIIKEQVTPAPPLNFWNA